MAPGGLAAARRDTAPSAAHFLPTSVRPSRYLAVL